MQDNATRRKTEDELAREQSGGVKGSEKLQPAPMTPARQKKTSESNEPGHTA